MKPPRRAARLACISALLGISVSTFSVATASADLARCAGIQAPDARLACYDALAGRSADHAPSNPQATPTPAVPLAPAAAPAFASDPRNFGFSEAEKRAQAQPHAAPEGPASIQARVTKIVDNSRGRAYVVLDNGESWMFVDSADDARLSPGDSVTIKKGSLGSFLLLTPSKRSYHVHRMQ